MAAGAGRLCADVSTQVQVIIMEAASVARLPILKAFLSTHVQSIIMFAEVRAGDGGRAVVIAESVACEATRGVHLGGAPPALLLTGVHT